MATHWYFKAFNSIKDPHEFDFAELELSSLFGKVRKVRNFADEIAMTASPLAQFTTDDVRIQDALLYEPSYGQLQGFYGVEQIFNAEKVGRLVRRLAYTKEVYVITETTETPTSLLRQVFPSRAVDAIEKTSRGYRKSDSVLLRLVTDEYYLEKSQYVSKLSRDEKETSNNLDILLKYPFEELYRIPASSTLQVGKRLQDYFAIREESSLYLTHIWHPYKAKFHAKMSRALLNYICPNDNALVMDNWAGSGTLNVEATLMGLDNIGLEINPLSVLMADVKASILAEDARNVKDMIAKFLSELELRLSKASSAAAETTLLEFGDASSGEVTISKKVSEMGGQVIGIQSELKGLFTQEQIQEFIIARDLIRQRYTGLTQEFLLLALSGSISDLARRRKGKLFEVITLRLYHLMYARLWLFQTLRKELGISLGKSAAYICDNRDISTCSDFAGKPVKLEEAVVDAVVTSPPYSTAIDYIKNDYPQLRILNLVDSKPALEKLERDMQGNPKPRVYRDAALIREMEKQEGFHTVLPKQAINAVDKLRRADRQIDAIRCYKFFKDLYMALISLNKLMKLGGKCAIVIGNNNYKLNETEQLQVANDRIMMELALRPEVGFSADQAFGGILTRPLEKSQSGNIRTESILFLIKRDHTTMSTK